MPLTSLIAQRTRGSCRRRKVRSSRSSPLRRCRTPASVVSHPYDFHRGFHNRWLDASAADGAGQLAALAHGQFRSRPAGRRAIHCYNGGNGNALTALTPSLDIRQDITHKSPRVLEQSRHFQGEGKPRPYILRFFSTPVPVLGMPFLCSGLTPGSDGLAARRGIADGSLVADGLQEIAQVN